jgi:hypothetical protein
VRGSLTKRKGTPNLRLDEDAPRVYSLGVKELWELPDDRYLQVADAHAGLPFGSMDLRRLIYGMQVACSTSAM